MKDRDYKGRFIKGHKQSFFKHTIETKKKISKAHVGLKATAETKQKMSLAKKGKNYDEIYGVNGAKRKKIKMSNMMKGNKNPAWNGGEVIRNGYVYIYKPKHPRSIKTGYVYKQYLIAEKVLKRTLKKGETVHHVNFNSLDNKKNNLLICNRSYHYWLHYKIKKLGKISNFKN